MTDKASAELTDLERRAQHLLQRFYEQEYGAMVHGVSSLSGLRALNELGGEITDQIGEKRLCAVLQPVQDEWRPTLADIGVLLEGKDAHSLSELNPTDPDLWELIALHGGDTIPSTLFKHNGEEWVPINAEVEKRLDAVLEPNASDQAGRQ